MSKRNRSGKPKAKASRRSRKSDLHPRVMISGYYGFDNLGDELILRVLTDALKARDVKVTVLSANPKKTAETYGVDAIQRTSVIDIIDALAYTNLFISGGGGLFQDATGPMSVLYYGGLIRLARFFEVPACIWGQGVGPLSSQMARRLTASAFRQCETIIVRDETSARLVESLGPLHAEVTADPVWLLDIKAPKPAKNPNRPWRVGISLRPWQTLTPERLQALAICLKNLVNESLRPVEFLLFPFQQKEDPEVLSKLAGYLEESGVKGECVMVEPEDVLNRLPDCDILLGMRFHALVLGILHDVPVYGLVYDPKVAALLETFRLQGTPIEELEHLTPEALQDAFDEYPVINLKSIRKQAKRNLDVLDALLEIPEAELVL